ncbi:MAG TPA: EamA family transporter [Candidatus Merdisoma merdipullorum]|nr:EamA family transporter [Candidatus Merdisoma merdipullorum]
MRKLSKEEKKTFLGLQLLLLLYSMGGIFSKLAAGYPFLSKEYILYYGMVLFTLVIYALGWQQVIKRLPLITAYASKAVTVIWGVVWGALIFKEQITVTNVIGAAVIIAGILLVVSGEEN